MMGVFHFERNNEFQMLIALITYMTLKPIHFEKK